MQLPDQIINPDLNRTEGQAISDGHIETPEPARLAQPPPVLFPPPLPALLPQSPPTRLMLEPPPEPDVPPIAPPRKRRNNAAPADKSQNTQTATVHFTGDIDLFDPPTFVDENISSASSFVQPAAATANTSAASSISSRAGDNTTSDPLPLISDSTPCQTFASAAKNTIASRPSRTRKTPSRNKDFVPTMTRSKNYAHRSS